MYISSGHDRSTAKVESSLPPPLLVKGALGQCDEGPAPGLNAVATAQLSEAKQLIGCSGGAKRIRGPKSKQVVERLFCVKVASSSASMLFAVQLS